MVIVGRACARREIQVPYLCMTCVPVPAVYYSSIKVGTKVMIVITYVYYVVLKKMAVI